MWQKEKRECVLRLFNLNLPEILIQSAQLMRSCVLEISNTQPTTQPDGVWGELDTTHHTPSTPLQ